MVQYNTEAAVPFFASTRGYGLLWDNNAWSHLNPPTTAPLTFTPDAKTPGLRTATFTATASGDHAIWADLCPGFGCGGTIVLNITLVDKEAGTSQIVQAWDALTNLPDAMAGRAAGLKKGTAYELRIVEVGSVAFEKVYVAPPPTSTTVSSQLGQLIDYYFTYAGTATDVSPLDGAISGYREVTGAAPLYGKWVYGFWQCKEHYKTQAELLGAAARFRAEAIPLDAIVQDWHYWGDLGWGPQWDPKVYPDPAAMVANLTANDLKLMVSVWSKFDPQTKFYKAMDAKGWLLKGTNYYDAWNAEARELFYSSKDTHFSIGVESLWLDATARPAAAQTLTLSPALDRWTRAP